MDMELQRITLEGYHPACDMMFSQEETLESIVPDACPDISRIVSAVGKVFLKDKELGEGTLRLTGTARITVLYIPEGEVLPRALEVSIPFQCTKDDPRFHSGCPVHAVIQASSADARAINPRKILVRTELTIWTAAYARESRELSCDITGGEGIGIEKQFSTTKCCLISEALEKDFMFSDVLRPPASKPEMEELLLCRTELGAVDGKFIGKKLVLKGDIQLTVLYRSGDGLSQVRFELPYSQILDLEEGAEEAEPEVAVVLKGVDCRLVDGELEISVEALAQAVLWVHRPIDLICDAYSISQPIDVELDPVRLCTIAELSSRREMARKLCESDIPAKQVLDCVIAVASIAGMPAEGGMEFTARCNVNILYISEDDALCGIETDIPVTCRVDLPAEGGYTCRCRPLGEVTAVPVTGGVEVRFEAEFSWTILQEERVKCVAGVKLGTVQDDTARPSVVIRRVGEGETLWDIAKSCGATVADICGVNELSAQTGAAGSLLLIPTRRG